MRFDELGLDADILRSLEAMNFEEMTPVQEHTIPIILENKDLIGCAQTGTGKTAAYTLPLLDKLLREGNPDNVVKSLIVVPTRELAQQIDVQFQGFSYFLPLSTTVVYGGGDGIGWEQQKQGMLRGSDIVVATPGRLLAHIANSGIDLSHVSYFVLDEADRMLDMGFIHDIKRILPLLPKERQTLFFSATMPSDIVTLANSMLHDPVHVTVTPPASVVETISQSVMFAEKAEKKDLLISLLRERSEGSVLVFSRTKHGADRIARILTKAGIEGRAIHGDKSQGARERAMNDFRAGRCRVLIATDIAARGIDISELPLVINYDLPEVAETYVHRIGRTGRAGHDGTAIAFCSEDERPLLKDIQKLTGLVLDPDSGRLTPGMQTDTKSPREQESSKPAAPKQAAQGAAGRTPAGQSGDAKGPRRRRRNAPKREGQAQSAHAPQPQNGGGQASENREPGRRRPHRRRRSDRKSEGQRS